MPEKLLLKKISLLCLFAVSVATTLTASDRKVLTSYGVKLSPPPVSMAKAGKSEATTQDPKTGYILKKLPIAKISVKEDSSRLNVTSENEKYGYLRNNISLVKNQLGSGFEIIQDGMFILASDASESERINQATKTLQICKNALKNEFFDASLKNPVTVFAFKNKESYQYNLKRLWDETPISPYGHYNYVRKHIIFNLSTGLGTMIHELTHALMDADMPRAPIWIAEGMASLYEQCIVDRTTIKGAVNWRLPELLRKIDTESFTPLEELLNLSDSEFKQKESLHYAQARYFCMYLEHKGVLKQVYKDFRDNYTYDHSGLIFVENALGKNIARIQDDWKTWAKTLRYNEDTQLSAK